MKVLVTGSSGLIGRWTCDLMVKEGHDVLGIDKRPKPDGTGSWPAKICDLLDVEALEEVLSTYAPTHVLHLAARTDLEGEDLQAYAANTIGVSNLITAIEGTPSVTRAVFTSSQLVCKVGHIPKLDDEYLPSTVYGESKVETEERVRASAGKSVSWCLARPTTVWGPHMSEHYTSLLKFIECGRYFHAGSGALHKSYSYAGNIAFQYMKLLSADSAAINGRVFYLADYEPLSLRDYVNALADGLKVRRPMTLPLSVAWPLAWVGDLLGAVGLSFPFNSFRLRNIRTEYIFDMSLTQSVCGDLPFSFEMGVRETLEWYNSRSR